MLGNHENTYRFIVWVRRQQTEPNRESTNWVCAIHRVLDLSEDALQKTPKKIFLNDISKIQSAIERLVADESETN